MDKIKIYKIEFDLKNKQVKSKYKFQIYVKKERTQENRAIVKQ